MQVKQAYEWANEALKMTLGDEAVTLQDEAGIITMGQSTIMNENMQLYGKNLTNVIAKSITCSDKYQGAAPNILKDGAMFGAITRMTFISLPESRENEAWELQDGASVDPFVFRDMDSKTRYFSGLTTLEVDYSITTKMIRQSFRSEAEMVAFIAGIAEAVENRMVKDTDAFIMATFDNMIAETIQSDYAGEATSSKSGVKAINVLKLYNTIYGKSLVAGEQALQDEDFLAFVRDEMNTVWNRMRVLHKLYNIEGYEGFTPAERRRAVYLDKFINHYGTAFKRGSYNPEYTTIPEGEKVSYWQGTGTDWDWSSISKIHVKTSEGNTIEQANVLACYYDEYALSIFNDVREDGTIYNPKGRYTNYFHSQEARYVNVPERNFIVFFMA